MDATTAPTAVEMLDELKAAGVRVLSSAHLPEIRSMVAQLRAERAAASAVVSVGWALPGRPEPARPRPPDRGPGGSPGVVSRAPSPPARPHRGGPRQFSARGPRRRARQSFLGVVRTFFWRKP